MKIKLENNLKNILIILSILLFIVCVVLLVKECATKKYDNKQRIIYSFDTKECIDFTVAVKDDSMYGNVIQPEKNTFISKYVNKINLNYNNVFSSDDKANIKGKFNVTGRLVGFIESEKEDIVVWTKDIVFIPTKRYKCNNNIRDINENIIIDYDYYYNLCKQINDVTEIRNEQKLEITMNLDYEVTKNTEKLQVKSNPKFVIPLSKEYFTLLKPEPAEAKENIIVQEEVELSPNKKLIVILIVLCLLSILVNVTMWLFTTQPSKVDRCIKNIIKLLKNYDKYLVAINNDSSYMDYTMKIKVDSFNDLVKISDEIERPIMYVKRNRIIDIDQFFITDKGCSYIYIINTNILSKSN